MLQIPKSSGKNLKNFGYFRNFAKKIKKVKEHRIFDRLNLSRFFYDFCGFGNVLIWKSIKNTEKWAIGRQKIRRYGRERALTNFQNLKNLSILRMVWKDDRGRRLTVTAVLHKPGNCRCCPGGWPSWPSSGQCSVPLSAPVNPSSRESCRVTPAALQKLKETPTAESLVFENRLSRFGAYAALLNQRNVWKTMRSTPSVSSFFATTITFRCWVCSWTAAKMLRNEPAVVQKLDDTSANETIYLPQIWRFWVYTTHGQFEKKPHPMRDCKILGGGWAPEPGVEPPSVTTRADHEISFSS
jgi:hypothetical protein